MSNFGGIVGCIQKELQIEWFSIILPSFRKLSNNFYFGFGLTMV